MEEDGFLEFVESCRLMLLQFNEPDQPPGNKGGGCCNGDAYSGVQAGPSWGWVCGRILECCKSYSSGVTPAILLSDLFKAWLEKSRVERGWKCKESGGYNFPGMAIYKRQKQRRSRLPNIVTIDSIYEKKFVPLDAVLEAVILDIQLLSGTSSYLLTLGDAWSSNSIDLYLHRKFYGFIDAQNSIFKKGREIRLTGCRLRTAIVAGASQTRLLPTEYLVVLLDEEQDEDALLLGARFCSDTFSSIQSSCTEAGAEYCFYARLEKIGEVEVHADWNHIKQQKFFLKDENAMSMPLVLWDEQISLAGLFSEGSMIALERPFISQGDHCFYLEYGSASCLFTVPYVHHEEQVTLESSQSRNKSHKVHLLDQTRNDTESQHPVTSQFMLPTDSQGSIDYCNFPLRLLVADVRPKMSNVSIYGVVRSLGEVGAALDISQVGEPSIHQITVQDHTGAIEIKLSFGEGWRSQQLDVGHTVFITGLRSIINPHKRMECLWNEKDVSARLVNITQLPALLTSPCLYQLVPLSRLLRGSWGTQVCKVRVRNITLDQIRSRPAHAQCGQCLYKDASGKYMCRFCRVVCHNDDISYGLCMVLHLYDNHLGVEGECVALSHGRSATEFLQASAEDFFSWPEDEQALYLYSLQIEEYMVTIYEGLEDSTQSHSEESYFTEVPNSPWRIGQALKCEL